MVRMQELMPEFEKVNPDADVHFVTLEENILRQKVPTDIATKAGQYDILTIGNYEVPIWGKSQWFPPMDDLDDTYEVNDLLPKVRASLSYSDKLYAAPFYAESSMTYFRKELFAKANLTMPEKPTREFLKEAASKTVSIALLARMYCLSRNIIVTVRSGACVRQYQER